MITINEIAKLVNGKVIGDGAVKVKGISALAFAEANDMTFAFDRNSLDEAVRSKAACVMFSDDVTDYPKTILKVENMKLAMTVLYNAMLEIIPPKKGTIHSTSVIDETVQFGKNVSVGPNTVIGSNTRIGDNFVVGANCTIGRNVTIGSNVCLYPNVTVYDNVIIKNNVTIHAGTVLGADGFGYIPKDGKIYKVPQMGTVILEDNVEIGANVCIDKGTFKDTIVGAGTKIDNQVQVAHNVTLGKNIMIAAQTGIAGSSSIGENTLIGGQVGVADHVKIGKNVKVGAKTGITGSVKDNASVFGYPSREASEARKLHGLLSLLLRNRRKIQTLFRKTPE
ncbi:MAG: UDP-3-O-(3-hydroxymyristoyl)glucosamine N-acyltransferase [Candidatus Omnitrophota bacterium]